MKALFITAAALLLVTVQAAAQALTATEIADKVDVISNVFTKYEDDLLTNSKQKKRAA